MTRVCGQAPPAKTIPFDYVFQFALQGIRGNKVQDVVEISSEGVFVALSVGYSLMLDEQRTAAHVSTGDSANDNAPQSGLRPFFRTAYRSNTSGRYRHSWRRDCGITSRPQ